MPVGKPRRTVGLMLAGLLAAGLAACATRGVPTLEERRSGALANGKTCPNGPSLLYESDCPPGRIACLIPSLIDGDPSLCVQEDTVERELRERGL